MYLVLLATVVIIRLTYARESVWTAEITQKHNGSFYVFPNYLYKDSSVLVTLVCKSPDKGLAINVVWMLVEMNCMQDMYRVQPMKQESILSFLRPERLSGAPSWAGNKLPQSHNYTTVKFQISFHKVYECGDERIVVLEDESDSPWYIAQVPSLSNKPFNASLINLWKVERKSNVEDNSTSKYRVTSTWQTGMFHFMFTVMSERVDMTPSHFTATAYVQMLNSYGYLSAINWPLLPYSAVTSFLYLVLGSVWIIVWVKAQHHTSHIHMLIGIVTIAGGVANTMIFIQQTTVNSRGQGFIGLEWISLIFSYIQNNLTNMLLMVVSTGYAITRPVLQKNLVVLIICLVSAGFLSSVGVMIVTDERLKVQYNVPALAVVVTLCYVLIMLIIGAFIMVQSILTAVHLYKRKHSQQIIFFSIFMAACVTCFIAEVLFLGVGYGWFSSCRQDWRHEWLFKNFGTMITLVLLCVLMWLWRPQDISKSYAFFPLSTTGDEDLGSNEEEMEEEDTAIFDKTALTVKT